MSRGRTENFQSAQAGRGSRLDAKFKENFEDMFFHCGFAVPENGGDLAVGFALGKPEQSFGDTRS